MFSEGRVLHIISLVTKARIKLHEAGLENDEPITTRKFKSVDDLLEQAENTARLVDVPFDGNSAQVAGEILERIEANEFDEE